MMFNQLTVYVVSPMLSWTVIKTQDNINMYICMFTYTAILSRQGEVFYSYKADCIIRVISVVS